MLKSNLIDHEVCQGIHEGIELLKDNKTTNYKVILIDPFTSNADIVK